MQYDAIEVGKIAAVALASCTLLGLIVGLYEGRRAGVKTFAYLVPLAGSFATLQVVEASAAPWVVLFFAAVAVAIHRRLR